MGRCVARKNHVNISNVKVEVGLDWVFELAPDGYVLLPRLEEML